MERAGGSCPKPITSRGSGKASERYPLTLFVGDHDHLGSGGRGDDLLLQKAPPPPLMRVKVAVELVCPPMVRSSHFADVEGGQAGNAPEVAGHGGGGGERGRHPVSFKPLVADYI